MDTRQLAAFCAVVERRSFSQAADRLGVTQPAVSLQVRALEKRLGMQLLDRSGRRVEPTESGLKLYRSAQRLPIRFYLETGRYDNVPSAGLPLHEMVLDETNTMGNRHFRDVLMAKGYDVTYREVGAQHENVHWRAMLADGLMMLLPPADARPVVK